MHPFCRCKATTPMETKEDIQADIDRLLDGRSIEDIERELDRQIAEQNALTTEQTSAIIDNNNEKEKYSPITDDDISRVPHMDIFGNDELNFAHEAASRNLLEEVKRQQELGAVQNGTEFSIIYDKDMNEFNGMKYVVGEKDKTEILDLETPYHAFHTHPDDMMHSLRDLQGIADRDNMLSLTAQGERGSKYVVSKTNDYDKYGYKNYLTVKSKDEIYRNGNIAFSLDFMYNDRVNYKTNTHSFYPKNINSLKTTINMI